MVDIGLIKGRHDMPVLRWVFQEEIPQDKMNDYDWMRKVCSDYLQPRSLVRTPSCLKGVMVRLYVTGFTPLLVAFLDAWDQWIDDTLTLMHYNPKTQEYHEQIWK